MKTKKIVVQSYDPQWPADFESIRRELAAGLGKLVLRIEHVGSTSVPGLAAKAIIDIDAVISDDCDFSAVVRALRDMGYEHEGDLGIPMREAFRYEGKTHLRKHHLYICPESSPELHRHLTFRDYLRTHPEAAERYSAAKREAAQRYPNSVDDYIRCKSPCIEAIYTQCGLI